MSTESCDEIIHIPEEQENFDKTMHAGNESIDEPRYATGCDAGTDNDDPGSVEYHYIDDDNPLSAHQDLEESQSEVKDYEDIAGTNPAYVYIQAVNETLTLTSKCKKEALFLVPVFASLTLKIIAGFYTSVMFLTLVLPRNITFEDGEIAAEVGTTFLVFSVLAAASCAPLMIRFGFRKVAVAGSVLIICSSILSSLTTTADILSFPFGIMGGFAVGHLRTLGVVASVDHLYTALALVVSHAGFTLGNIGGIFGLETLGWHMDRRLFDITAVMGLAAGCCLQRTSQARENVSMLVKHPLFYFLISIRLVTSVGISILLAETMVLENTIFVFGSRFLVLIVLAIVCIFQKEKLKDPYVFSMGICLVAVAVVAVIHQDDFDGRGAVVASSLLLGAVTASPVKKVWYFAGGFLIIAGVGSIIAAMMIKRWPSLSNDREAEECVEDQVREAEEHVEGRP